MKATTREHYTRLEPGAITHRHPVCGCRLIRQDDGAVALYQCPTHGAAPELLAALECAEGQLRDLAERAGDDPEWNRGGNGWVAWTAARIAIARAKGGAA